jgi:hypothetical protein
MFVNTCHVLTSTGDNLRPDAFWHRGSATARLAIDHHQQQQGMDQDACICEVTKYLQTPFMM